MYIRTEDGIYEVVGFDEECIIPSTLIKVKNEYGKERITHCCKDDIISQSDTIEELCDEFVLALKDSKKNPNDNIYDKEEYYSIYQHIGYAKDYYDEDYNDLYGCIWTSKGLIYVAKMDSDGKLMLI